jgi:DNA-binding protein HU-beta
MPVNQGHFVRLSAINVEKTPIYRVFLHLGPLHVAKNAVKSGLSLIREKGTPMATKAAAKKTETVSTRQLAVQLAEKHDLSQKAAGAILDDLITNVTKHLKKGARIRLNGLGILQVKKRAARMGRNPATGEAIKIKASKKVAFRAAKDLKEAI